MKIGAVTVGQSPRTDVTEDIMRIFDGKITLIEAGALDGMSYEEISELKPEEGDYVLVSRMNDGRQVTFAERLILGRIQACIDRLEQQGVKMILFFCTGEFKHSFRSAVPLIFPCQILHQIVPVLAGSMDVIIVNPSLTQREQSLKKWGRILAADKVEFVAASPYGSWEEIGSAIEQIKQSKGKIVILDCIGYSQKMKDVIYQKTQKTVILSRTLLARVVSEVTDINNILQ